MNTKQEDVGTLRYIASELSYDNSPEEAKLKHRLNEIAMRIQTGYYSKLGQTEQKVPALLKPPFVVT